MIFEGKDRSWKRRNGGAVLQQIIHCARPASRLWDGPELSIPNYPNRRGQENAAGGNLTSAEDPERNHSAEEMVVL